MYYTPFRKFFKVQKVYNYVHRHEKFGVFCPRIPKCADMCVNENCETDFCAQNADIMQGIARNPVILL